MVVTDFVWPYFANGDKNDELKLSIESVETYFRGTARITVVGDRPRWNYRHQFIRAVRVPRQPHRSFRDTFNRLQLTAKSKLIGEEFVWMMDDVFFVAPLSLDELRIPRYQSIMTPERVRNWHPSNVWLRLKKATMQELFRRGAREVRDYATHLPHVVTKQNIRQMTKSFSMPTKMYLWEVIYGNQYASVPPQHFRGFFYRFTRSQTWSTIKSNAGRVKIVNTGAYSFNRPAREALAEIISPKSETGMERTSAETTNKTQPCPFGFRGTHIGWRDNRLCGMRSRRSVPVFECHLEKREVTIDPYQVGQTEGCCKRCDAFWKPPQFIVVVSGIPRSGSTWAYNVCRIGLALKYGWQSVDFGFGLDPRHLGNPAAVIKVHAYESTYRQWASVVIHSTRDYDDALESWRRMNPEMDHSIDGLKAVDDKWTPKADYVFKFEEMMTNPTETAAAILKQIDSKANPTKVVSMVEDLKVPDKGVDPVSLLMPNHRRVHA